MVFLAHAHVKAIPGVCCIPNLGIYAQQGSVSRRLLPQGPLSSTGSSIAVAVVKTGTAVDAKGRPCVGGSPRGCAGLAAPADARGGRSEPGGLSEDRPLTIVVEDEEGGADRVGDGAVEARVAGAQEIALVVLWAHVAPRLRPSPETGAWRGAASRAPTARTAGATSLTWWIGGRRVEIGALICGMDGDWASLQYTWRHIWRGPE
ncbi:unnamed protein product [Chondrus crispus]|uniref:Uncharacterized protein n=1 Tax=Chondrus crispus TaxID=2769 RepID=R7QH07_CHOCR|nr:unnamed protein product [Chondrus crispus]CDF37013.1 unnamed protein product [Chondrus crispus]|eukprot:XP_005716832.1 unnamed protein product [Chondrus crispus]